MFSYLDLILKISHSITYCPLFKKKKKIINLILVSDCDKEFSVMDIMKNWIVEFEWMRESWCINSMKAISFFFFFSHCLQIATCHIHGVPSVKIQLWPFQFMLHLANVNAKQSSLVNKQRYPPVNFLLKTIFFWKRKSDLGIQCLSICWRSNQLSQLVKLDSSILMPWSTRRRQ